MASALLGLATRVLLLAAGARNEEAEVDQLVEQLSSDDGGQRTDAACGLGHLGRVASRAAPALAAVLQRQIVDSGMPTPRRPPRRTPDLDVDHCRLVQDEMREREWERRASGSFSGRDAFSLKWDRGPVLWAIYRLEANELAARSILDLFRREPELRSDLRTVPALLASLGPKALPALEEGLHDEVTQVRYLSVQAIPELRPLPPRAEAVLQDVIAWDNGDVRSEAVRGLENVRAQLRLERYGEARKQGRAASPRKDWLSEFPAYPGAAKVCSRPAITLYATESEPPLVVAFYSAARKLATERGATTLTTRSANGKKALSVHAVTDSYAGCGVAPPGTTKTVVVVSQVTP